MKGIEAATTMPARRVSNRRVRRRKISQARERHNHRRNGSRRLPVTTMRDIGRKHHQRNRPAARPKAEAGGETGARMAQPKHRHLEYEAQNLSASITIHHINIEAGRHPHIA